MPFLRLAGNDVGTSGAMSCSSSRSARAPALVIGDETRIMCDGKAFYVHAIAAVRDARLEPRLGVEE